MIESPRKTRVTPRLPPEDWIRSPRTGWTRPHWEHLADVLLDGVRAHASPSHALVNLPGRASTSGRKSDGLEGFARTFLLAAFRLRGSEAAAPGDLVDRYSSGLAAGTDAGGREAWLRHEHYAQSLVEAAAVAIGLHETRPWIWDRLPTDVRERTVGWLQEVQGKRHWHSNWLLFPVVVNAFLKTVGAPYRQEEIDRNLDVVDTMYRGGGWYADGRGRSFDHYVGWAFHFYTLLWCRMDGERSDPGRAAVYRERLRLFLEDYRYMFAANGAPLHHGRSLVYRFAVAAPFWAGALANATPLTPGETRRIASGTVRYFLERGALRAGVLPLGWHGEFLGCVQDNSGPGSPYWASKGFLGLLLPVTHPVWTAPEEPMAVERGDFTRAMEEPGFLAWGTQGDGIVRASSNESDHFPFSSKPLDNAHYRKLAYSTHTAPSTGRGDELDLDSQVSLEGGNAEASRRRSFAALAVTGSFAASVSYPFEPGRLARSLRWLSLERRFPIWLERCVPLTRVPYWRPALWLARQAPARGLGIRLERVETVSIPRGRTEIRIHHVSTPFPRTVRAGGFAVADVEPPAVETGPTWALARGRDGLTSFVAGIHGFERADAMRLDDANAFGRHSATPLLSAHLPVRDAAIFVSLVVLTAEPVDPEELRRSITAADVSRDEVALAFADGDDLLVRLGAPRGRGLLRRRARARDEPVRSRARQATT